MNVKARLLKEAKTSISESHRMMSRLDNVISSDDISLLYTASNQAIQAAKEINQLIGFIQCEKEKS